MVSSGIHMFINSTHYMIKLFVKSQTTNNQIKACKYCKWSNFDYLLNTNKTQDISKHKIKGSYWFKGTSTVH